MTDENGCLLKFLCQLMEQDTVPSLSGPDTTLPRAQSVCPKFPKAERSQWAVLEAVTPAWAAG